MTQDKYAIMACTDIIRHRNALTAQEKNLSGLVEKAESSPGGFIAGYAAYRSELGETRMKLRLAQQAAAATELRRAEEIALALPRWRGLRLSDKIMRKQ